MKTTLIALGFVLLGSFAFGQVTGEVRDGKIVIISSEPVQAAGVDLKSEAGLLVPVEDPPGADPFDFFLANTPNQITWGNLGTSVTLDGEWETAAGYLGDDPVSDLTASWGNGPEPVAFPVTVVPEPSSGLLVFCSMIGLLYLRPVRRIRYKKC